MNAGIAMCAVLINGIALGKALVGEMPAAARPHRRKRFVPCGLLSALLLSGPVLSAQADDRPDDGVLVMGVRADAAPFSALDRNQRYTGYSVSLCQMIAQRAISMGVFCGARYEPVDTANRFAKLGDGSIDMLCGATTVTLARQRIADFSLFTFLSGASLMYRINPEEDDDAQNKAFVIGVLQHTTTDIEVRRIAGEFRMRSEMPLPASNRFTVSYTKQHDEALDLLRSGEIDAYLADREILLALKQKAAATERDNPGGQRLDLKVSEHYYTFEPYAIGINRDRRALLYVANLVLTELFDWESQRSRRNIYNVLAQSFPNKRFSKALQSMFRLQRIPIGGVLGESGFPPLERRDCGGQPAHFNIR